MKINRKKKNENWWWRGKIGHKKEPTFLILLAVQTFQIYRPLNSNYLLPNLRPNNTQTIWTPLKTGRPKTNSSAIYIFVYVCLYLTNGIEDIVLVGGNTNKEYQQQLSLWALPWAGQPTGQVKVAPSFNRIQHPTSFLVVTFTLQLPKRREVKEILKAASMLAKLVIITPSTGRISADRDEGEQIDLLTAN